MHGIVRMKNYSFPMPHPSGNDWRRGSTSPKRKKDFLKRLFISYGFNYHQRESEEFDLKSWRRNDQATVLVEWNCNDKKQNKCGSSARSRFLPAVGFEGVLIGMSSGFVAFMYAQIPLGNV